MSKVTLLSTGESLILRTSDGPINVYVSEVRRGKTRLSIRAPQCVPIDHLDAAGDVIGGRRLIEEKGGRMD